LDPVAKAAGFDDKPMSSMTTEELKARLDKIEAELGERAEVVREPDDDVCTDRL
jgi:hypothetical protein